METCKNNVLYLGVLTMFLFFQASSATDTISTDQPLSGLKTIVSSGDIFELGLFNPTPGMFGFYIGMWYKQVSPRTIVWVANRESPLQRATFFFKILDGNLILHDNMTSRTFWSTGVNSSRSTDVEAVLLDNGNLVLRDGPNSSAAVLWQSFDHPSDTWLPGAKIRFNNIKLGSQRLTSWKGLTDPSPGRYSLEVDPNTTHSLITVWNGSKSYWSSGPWDDQFRVSILAISLSFKLNLDESYITYSAENYSTYRLVMDVSGRFMLHVFLVDIQLWGAIWSQPRDTCAVYNSCGSFGICDEQAVTPCRCVPGFKQAFGEDSNDYSGGCKREINLQCDKGNDEFFPIENMKLATDPTTTLVLTASLVTSCASACLANCSCQAYAYDGNKCLMWTRDAFNLQQLDAHNTEGHIFFLRLAASNKGETENSKVRRIVLPVVLSSLIAAAAFFVGLYCYISQRGRRKRTKRDEKQSRELLEGGLIDDDGENMCYLNLHDIMAATNSFSEENKLGEGGFGPVYKGMLLNGMDVAIKRLSKKSSQGLTEFKNEVILIIKLQHKNLVRLLGYCVEGDEKLLIYEYMSNKSLDVFLFDSLKSRELDWETRMKIVTGTTRGLQYLHEYSRLRIIHRDLKASNILLDDEMNPKISDFGTARIFGCKQIDDSTQRIVGTFGYMSPEYALGGLISEKSDIYSFGVLLLEIISGKKATRFVHNDQKHSLIAYAWESWCETKGVSIIDEALCGSYPVKEVMRCVHIALLCVQDHPKDRPTISQIIYMLSNDNNLPIPKQPTFSNVLNGDQQLASSDYVFSINEATQTELEAR
ncbi:PAN/Apple domain [Arabidopsis thaliana x Arabidopsis arenosa]|uniref:Receptor-like serine/threonine-protein kinase n=1 Tax=Arabidopsis thaliana x Arabidopsis arenosa TaxID=1240361 RepID=A0A8T1Z1W3_9BRAS|nr:PAN/Apple domain [Arabidopsis thaliana x Arabidopsis arenosa]